MSKAILIMDMPESCGECEYHDIRMDGTIRCIVCKEHMGESASICGRADWCPLRELPEKKEPILYEPDDYYIGYNDCLDDILGGEI